MLVEAQGKRFEKIKKVGEGTYGSVTKFYDHKENIFIAIKKLKFQDDEESNFCFNSAIPINALREIQCLKELDHPNIIKYPIVNIKNPQCFVRSNKKETRNYFLISGRNFRRIPQEIRIAFSILCASNVYLFYCSQFCIKS